MEVQLASLKAVTVYVLVEAGETLNEYGLVVTPFTVVLVVPSKYVKLQGEVPVNVTVKVAVPLHRF
jgi:hypothetical protein